MQSKSRSDNVPENTHKLQSIGLSAFLAISGLGLAITLVSVWSTYDDYSYYGWFPWWFGLLYGIFVSLCFGTIAAVIAVVWTKVRRRRTRQRFHDMNASRNDQVL